MKVVVLGDVVADVVARLAEPLAPGSDAAAAIERRPGGAGANVAAWLAVAGVDVTLVARVGDDRDGEASLAGLAGHGVRLEVAVDPRRRTGALVALVAPDGERTMVSDRGANLALEPADLPTGRFVRGGHLHVSGYTLLHDGPRPAALTALRLARETGMTVSVDPASARPLATAGTARFLADTRGADWCLPNRAEAHLLSGLADPSAAAHTLCRDYREVAVTLGAEGACWTDGDRTVARPAAPARVIDTTGAGDAFTAGFLAARLTGRDPEQALAAGLGLAASAVAQVGARE